MNTGAILHAREGDASPSEAIMDLKPEYSLSADPILYVFFFKIEFSVGTIKLCLPRNAKGIYRVQS